MGGVPDSTLPTLLKAAWISEPLPGVPGVPKLSPFQVLSPSNVLTAVLKWDWCIHQGKADLLNLDWNATWKLWALVHVTKWCRSF